MDCTLPWISFLSGAVARAFWIASWVKSKSRAVTGTRSLQRALGRMRYVNVNGGFFVTVTLETSRSFRVKSGAVAKAGSQDLLGEEAQPARGRVHARVAVQPDDDGAPALRRLLGHAGGGRHGDDAGHHDAARANDERLIRAFSF